ncbi:hypothetical protein Tco_1137730, partial [Tanacetum coccineum]
MGVCGSKEQGCVRIGHWKKHNGDRDGEGVGRIVHNNGKRRRRRLGRKKANNAVTNKYSSRSKVDPSVEACNSIDNPAFR